MASANNTKRILIIIKKKKNKRLVYEPLSTIKAQSECSSVVCVVRIELYGSTTAVEICGAG